MISAPARRWLRHRGRERWSGLDLTIELPEDWQLEWPAEEAIDFDSEPARLMPLRAHSRSAPFGMPPAKTAAG